MVDGDDCGLIQPMVLHGVQIQMGFQMMVDESGREKSESMRDKRNEHDCGYDGADGGDNGGDDGHDDEEETEDADDEDLVCTFVCGTVTEASQESS